MRIDGLGGAVWRIHDHGTYAIAGHTADAADPLPIATADTDVGKACLDLAKPCLQPFEAVGMVSGGHGRCMSYGRELPADARAAVAEVGEFPADARAAAEVGELPADALAAVADVGELPDDALAAVAVCKCHHAISIRRSPPRARAVTPATANPQARPPSPPARRPRLAIVGIGHQTRCQLWQVVDKPQMLGMKIALVDWPTSGLRNGVR